MIYAAQQATPFYLWASLNSYGVNFNGQNSIVQNLAAAPLNNLPTYTAASWVYLDSYNPQGSAIYSEGIPAATFILYVGPTGRLSAQAWNSGTPGNWKSYSSNVIVPLGRWVFVADTLSNGGARTFFASSSASNINSEAFPLQSESNAGAHYLGIGGSIGYLGAQSQMAFNGMIADLQLYNAALSASQIQQLYQSQMPPTASAAIPIGWVP